MAQYASPPNNFVMWKGSSAQKRHGIFGFNRLLLLLILTYYFREYIPLSTKVIVQIFELYILHLFMLNMMFRSVMMAIEEDHPMLGGRNPNANILTYHHPTKTWHVIEENEINLGLIWKWTKEFGETYPLFVTFFAIFAFVWSSALLVTFSFAFQELNEFKEKNPKPSRPIVEEEKW